MDGIEILATYSDGLTANEAISKSKEQKKHILTNLEHDELLNGEKQEWKNYKSAYWAWAGTHIKYSKGSLKAEVWNDGEKKHTVIDFPLSDGWYLVNNKYGIPNGEKSDSSNPKARYLWRLQSEDFEGLVARGYVLFVDDRRGVSCGGDQSRSYGVLCNSATKGAGKPNVESDKALVWLTTRAKTNKNAKEILKRLKESES